MTARAKRPTAAQRKVLELLAGGNIACPGVSRWYLRHPDQKPREPALQILPSVTCHKLRRFGWIDCPTSSTGAHRITAAGRRALEETDR